MGIINFVFLLSGSVRHMKQTRITLTYLVSTLTAIVMFMGSFSVFAPSADAKKKKKQSCVINKNNDYRFRVYFFNDSGKKIKAKTLKEGGNRAVHEVCGPRGSSVVVIAYEQSGYSWESLDTSSDVRENKCKRGIYNAKNKIKGGGAETVCSNAIPELAITDAALAKMKAVKQKKRTIFRGKLGVGGYNHLCFLDAIKRTRPYDSNYDGNKNTTQTYEEHPIVMYKGREGDKCRNKRNP
jgi:hypothetical protein